MKTKMMRKISAITLVIMLFISMSSTAYATGKSSAQIQKEIDKKNQEISNAQSELNSAEANLGKTEEKIEGLAEESEALTEEVEALEDELAQLLLDIEMLKEEIAQTEANIAQAEIDLAAAIETENHQYEMMKLRIVFMYEQGEESIITAFMEAGSLSDFLNRVEYISSVNQYDRNLLTAYEEARHEVEVLKANLEDEKLELEECKAEEEAAQAEMEMVLAQLESKLSDVNVALASAKKKAAAYRSTIDAQNAKISKAQQELQKLEQQKSEAKKEEQKKAEAEKGGEAAPFTASTGGSLNPAHRTGINGNDVVAFGRQYVGCPYVWGGNSLSNGCDCSGFVSLVFAHYGISVPRQSYSLRSVGQEVSYENAQPGDIVCYSGHVAIYMGGGRIVHAKNKSAGITEDYINYSGKPIITIRRVL